MENNNLKFGSFFWRISSSHMITYFIMGIIAASILNYKEVFENPPLSYLMKPIDSSWVAVGPVLQIFRGLVFSIVLWFFKDNFLYKRYGWLKLWGLIVGLCILSTTGPSPGSIEGLIYTKIPVISQLKGYFEVLPQTLLFSLLVFYWYKKPKKLWNVLSIILVSIIIILCTLGLIASTIN
ncbi:hypothetical protein [Maribellus mangrovi]|uniref:hypothetical protein n=1 Tax=Maribellus mangrovi TaxID=3133146 RepID=UPI0030EE21E0